MLKTILEDLGFVCHDTGDVSIFVSSRPGRATEILVVYVDDLTMMANSLDLITHTKEALSGHFSLKDLGELKHYLNIRVTRDRGSCLTYLDWKVYINSILKCFQHSNCNPATTPLPSSIILEKNLQDPSLCDPSLIHEYCSILGSLIYAMLRICLDIAYAITRLCQFHSNPMKQHLKAAKHIL